MSIVPNINANTYSLSAIVIAFILIDESTPAEQNSLGNWFMLIGQVLCTNSAQQQVLNNRKKKSTQTGTSANDGIYNEVESNQEQIDLLNKIVTAMQKEIDDLKKA